MTGLMDGEGPLRRITLAIDASEASAKAVSFVLTKFQPDCSPSVGSRIPLHVSVVHVMAHRPLAPIEFRFTVPWIKSENKAKDVSRRLVKQCAQHLIQAGFTAEPICKSGDPAEEIMKVASKKKADLIVMGAKGLGTIDRVLLGSVSMQVLQYANCPVLVVR
jgi:nucleotide-binding universal stress UspA family protein